jgi:hypothetical protein
MTPHDTTPVGADTDPRPVQEFESLEDRRKAVYPNQCDAGDPRPPMPNPWVERLFDEAYIN